MVGANRKVAGEDKLDFSVCKMDGEWSAVQVAQFAKDVATSLDQTPPTTHDIFVYDGVAFVNTGGHNIQGICYARMCLFVPLQLSKCWFIVLGVCPTDQTSSIHELIGMH